jgi:hypothetical protein
VNLAEKLVMRPIGALVPYASNSRTHTPEQKISKIARNVEAFERSRVPRAVYPAHLGFGEEDCRRHADLFAACPRLL